MSRFKNALNKKATLVLVSLALASALAAIAVVLHPAGSGQPDVESPPYAAFEDIDYHLREQRAQGRSGAEFCSPSPSIP